MQRSGLSRSFELHFAERPYLKHRCLLFITQTTRERMRSQSLTSALCRGRIVPTDAVDGPCAARFVEAVAQAERILADSGYIGLRRLTADEIVGADTPGILADYFTLGGCTVNEDIRIDPDGVTIGDKTICCHSLSDLDELPDRVATDSRDERLSTDRSDCRLSFAAPLGVMLTCNHLYNQFIFLDNAEQTLQRMERMARNLSALSRYSRSNAVNGQWIEQYLNEARAEGRRPVRCHCNVMAWGKSAEELARVKNLVGAQLAVMGATPHHNTVDVPALFWGAIPGGEADFPSEESFHTFLDQALCFFSAESTCRNSPSPFGIRLVDRLTGVPLHLDISDEPIRRGYTSNRNKFLVGPSGSGKSFIVNHLAHQYYLQGAHSIIVDVGHSYKGLCEMIHRKTNGQDGIYYTYSDEHPICFNPFYAADRVYDVEKRDSICTMILTLWKREDERPRRSEEVALANAVSLYLAQIRRDTSARPSFNGFYEFVDRDYRRLLRQKNIREQDFDIEGFLNVLAPFYGQGEYGFLLNADDELDLLQKRFVVFELDSIRDHRVLFPIVTLVIMDCYISKMRRLKGIRKVLWLDEAWTALVKAGMAEFIQYLYRTCRKYFGEVCTITQNVDDLISSPIVRDTIVNNADCQILLDMRRYMAKFDSIQNVLGLSDKARAEILSINQANDPSRKYKEVWISLGGIKTGVYAVEVSYRQYRLYSTEEKEKVELFELAEQRGGDLEAALRELDERNRQKT